MLHGGALGDLGDQPIEAVGAVGHELLAHLAQGTPRFPAFAYPTLPFGCLRRPSQSRQHLIEGFAGICLRVGMRHIGQASQRRAHLGAFEEALRTPHVVGNVFAVQG